MHVREDNAMSAVILHCLFGCLAVWLFGCLVVALSRLLSVLPELGFCMAIHRHCKHWGTKWDAHNVQLDEGEDDLTYTFATAWSPPLEWAVAASAQHPDIQLTLRFEEEVRTNTAYVNSTLPLTAYVNSTLPLDTAYVNSTLVLSTYDLFLESHGHHWASMNYMHVLPALPFPEV